MRVAEFTAHGQPFAGGFPHADNLESRAYQYRHPPSPQRFKPGEQTSYEARGLVKCRFGQVRTRKVSLRVGVVVSVKAVANQGSNVSEFSYTMGLEKETSERRTGSRHKILPPLSLA